MPVRGLWSSWPNCQLPNCCPTAQLPPTAANCRQLPPTAANLPFRLQVGCLLLINFLFQVLHLLLSISRCISGNHAPSTAINGKQPPPRSQHLGQQPHCPLGTLRPSLSLLVCHAQLSHPARIHRSHSRMPTLRRHRYRARRRTAAAALYRRTHAGWYPGLPAWPRLALSRHAHPPLVRCRRRGVALPVACPGVVHSTRWALAVAVLGVVRLQTRPAPGRAPRPGGR